MAEQVARLPGAVRALHWLGVGLILLAYLTGEAMEDGGAGASLHVLSGFGLLLMVVPRVGLHWWHRGRFAAFGPGRANVMARVVHRALLAFLLAQPILGMLSVWAEGDALLVPFTRWSIASPLAGGLGDWPGDLHEGLGNLFYAVIGAHAAAALWHHFVRRDPVLRQML